ncbi:DUF2510 domain-containing protein [Paeniglutamicibacter antarcticus]|uniref:DUF2510 domain-containing protein n=1 Tax=Arthrobacter terrae TaxID=2935737 RepID=A0A931G861_9MICC|nr:DUF2510 domain-containing protein [Arthrobacter terrae]MBG0739949.1 DUF2510 domain-containing protein [Arthrobacter terrae]
MTSPANEATVQPGWYPSPSNPGWLQWWDGTAWTEHFGGSPIPNPPMDRPEISAQTRVYNPFIWLIVLLPLLTVGLQLAWNPVFRYQYIGRGQLRTLDPASLYTPGYFLLLATGFIIYAVSVLLAYFDWRTLSRDGVVRPFHWAWTFLSATVYIIGRTVIVHKVAPGRGLATIWVLIAVVVLSFIAIGIKVSMIFASIGARIAG